MERNIDQVPPDPQQNFQQNPNYASPTGDQQNPNYQPPTSGHPEYVDGRNSQTFFGQNNIPADQYEGLPPISRHHNISKRTKVGVAIALGSVAAVVGTGYIGYQQKVKEYTQATDELWGSAFDNANSQSGDNSGFTLDLDANKATFETGDLDKISLEDFIDNDKVSTEQRVDFAAPIFNENWEKNAQDIVSGGQAVSLYLPIDVKDIDPEYQGWYSQTVYDTFAVNMNTLSKIGKTDPLKARKLLATIVDPHMTPALYNDYSGMIGKGGGVIDATGQVLDYTTVFNQTKFQTVQPNGLPTIVVTTLNHDRQDIPKRQNVLQMTKGNDESNVIWTVRQTGLEGSKVNRFFTYNLTELSLK